MSVEKQAECTSADAAKPMDDSKDSTVFPDDSMHTAVSETSSLKTMSIQGEGEEAEEATTGNVNEMTKEVLGDGAREWFKSLSAEELSVALSFSDEAFITALSSLASLSPRPAVAAAAEGGSDVGTGFVDLESLVDLREVESSFNVKTKIDSAPSVEETTMSGIDETDEAELLVLSDSNQTDNSELKKSRSSVFRIRKDSKEEGASTEEVHCHVLSDALRAMVEQIRVVFPKVWSMLFGGEVEGTKPLCMVHPSYFIKNTSEELLPALDVVFLSLFGSKFLCLDLCEVQIDSNDWISRLLGNANHHVPLYSVLLARLEWAAALHFCEKQKKVRRKQLVLPPGSSEANHEEESSSAGQYGSAHESESGQYETKEKSGDLTLWTDKNNLVSNLKFHLKELDAWEAEKGEASRDRCLLPLTKAFSVVGPGETKKAEHVILTPLAWVLTAGRSRTADLAAIDNAVGQSLKLVEESNAPDPEVEAEEEAHNELVATKNHEDVAEGILGGSIVKPAHAASESTGSKKKKKKRKKKKNAKSQAQKTVVAVKEAAVQFPEAEVIESGKDEDADEVPSASVTEEEVKMEEVAATIPDVDSNETEMTVDTVAQEIASVKSDVSEEMTGSVSESVSASPAKGDITVSRLQGYVVVAAPVTEAPTQKPVGGDGERPASEEKDVQNDDEDAWETVEVRGRGNRRKADKVNVNTVRQSGHSSANTSSQQDAAGARRQKNARIKRKNKEAGKKVAKEIINSILDAVDEEVKKKRQLSPVAAPVGNAWKTGPPGVRPSIPRAAEKSDVVVNAPSEKREKTLRDVLMGTHLSSPKRTVAASPTEKRLPRVDEKAKMRQEAPAKRNASPLKPSGLRGKGTSADQNTAPTYQETASAVSTSSNAPVESKGFVAEDTLLKSDSSSNDTDDAPQNKKRQVTTSEKDSSPTPPLPTLLSPENANSATSSVASSLEAPHAGPRHHHSNSAVDVNDVGYHLLDVCDRLSRDMNLFMNRRALALNERRKERGALLEALQDTASSLWPGRCHVEMYGSCATQLDLPSSDLDVVIIGLDRNMEMMMTPPATPQAIARSKSMGSESMTTTTSMEEGSAPDENVQAPDLQRHLSVPPFIPMAHRNAERVMRLATTLETLPWAVQVNAIPTASVPVVKVLADPSKLEASSKAGEWISHQHLAAQAATTAPSHLQVPTPAEEGGAQTGRHQYHAQAALLPWRGCDVMNGLLKLDITFEGPEHGGIGSTEFSALAVAEMCHESGLHPDATPFVQVLMVIKELLAQRKLNEPYSGGLSSYALLLLLVALMRERAVIREELERVERQKRAMSTDESNSFVPSDVPLNAAAAPELAEESTKGNGRKDPPNMDVSGVEIPSSGRSSLFHDPLIPASVPVPKTPSSWASIAKKNAAAKATPDKANEERSLKGKPSSFADVVGRNIQQTPRSQTQTTASNSSEKRTDSAKKQHASLANVQSEESPSPLSAAAIRTPTNHDIESEAAAANVTPTANMDPSLANAPAFFPQGFNDVIEVLCSGETTAGKLLMHFLLYYGEHFDAQCTAIDISGKHEREYMGQASPYFYLSPYIQRRAPGSIDPVTGMLTVDPIVIYDPLEGAENNNVARRCFAWTSVRWIFAQSYATLSSAVERSATPPTTPGGKVSTVPAMGNRDDGSMPYTSDGIGDLMDPSSPLLRCLLSF